MTGAELHNSKVMTTTRRSFLLIRKLIPLSFSDLISPLLLLQLPLLFVLDNNELPRDDIADLGRAVQSIRISTGIVGINRLY